MPDLVTLPYVKTVMGITATTGDAQLALLISAASDFFLTATYRPNLLPMQFFETRSGDGTSSLILRNSPILSVDTLTIDGVAPGAYSSLTNSRGFLVADNGFEVLLGPGGCLNQGIYNVSIAYTAGYTTVPLDVQEAVAEIVSFKKAKLPRIDQVSTSLGGETVSFSQKDVPPMVKPILLRYTQTRPFRSR